MKNLFTLTFFLFASDLLGDEREGFSTSKDLPFRGQDSVDEPPVQNHKIQFERKNHISMKNLIQPPNCWIYFQGAARTFASKLRDLLKRNGVMCGIDEDFHEFFPDQRSIGDCVKTSIRSLMYEGGIAIIIFTKQFFMYGPKNDYNPTDEFNFLISSHKLNTLNMLIPIWFESDVNEIVVPDKFQLEYDYVKNIPGHSKASDLTLDQLATKILAQIRNANLSINMEKFCFEFEYQKFLIEIGDLITPSEFEKLKYLASATFSQAKTSSSVLNLFQHLIHLQVNNSKKLKLSTLTKLLREIGRNDLADRCTQFELTLNQTLVLERDMSATYYGSFCRILYNCNSDAFNTFVNSGFLSFNSLILIHPIIFSPYFLDYRLRSDMNR